MIIVLALTLAIVGVFGLIVPRYCKEKTYQDGLRTGLFLGGYVFAVGCIMTL